MELRQKVPRNSSKDIDGMLTKSPSLHTKKHQQERIQRKDGVECWPKIARNICVCGVCARADRSAGKPP